jgi:hypothetical protein
MIEGYKTCSSGLAAQWQQYGVLARLRVQLRDGLSRTKRFPTSVRPSGIRIHRFVHRGSARRVRNFVQLIAGAAVSEQHSTRVALVVGATGAVCCNERRAAARRCVQSRRSQRPSSRSRSRSRSRSTERNADAV